MAISKQTKFKWCRCGIVTTYFASSNKWCRKMHQGGLLFLSLQCGDCFVLLNGWCWEEYNLTCKYSKSHFDLFPSVSRLIISGLDRRESHEDDVLLLQFLLYCCLHCTVNRNFEVSYTCCWKIRIECSSARNYATNFLSKISKETTNFHKVWNKRTFELLKKIRWMQNFVYFHRNWSNFACVTFEQYCSLGGHL